MKSGDFAKMELTTRHSVYNYMKPHELKKALTIVAQHRIQFEEQFAQP
jgi:hypothetical protein